eukprot:gnl/TRDRNA2_/TRDRNA2_86903_c0_seq1.p1 gnl/TRDRNA2_/TRDRNA2_86903_c0~~gnl/TRDRNA2_/TRDRNA2_86903_c0_seq1.p1  ORF type:complete len:188 (-),score=30.27 gnl/TRDRNA2_/TRDRNA2_86903_c0_seq1:245-808(-)
MSQPWPDACTCCDPPSSCPKCCMAGCCPCIVAGENHKDGGLGDQQCCKVGIGLGIDYSGAAVRILAGAIPDIMADEGMTVETARTLGMARLVGHVLQLIGWIIVIVFLWQGRQEIGKKFMRPTECCPDFFCVCCCYSLTLIQEFKVVKQGVPQQAGGGPALVGQPVMMSPPVVQGAVVQAAPVQATV